MNFTKLTREELNSKFVKAHDEYFGLLRSNVAFNDPEFVNVRIRLESIVQELKRRRRARGPETWDQNDHG